MFHKRLCVFENIKNKSGSKVKLVLKIKWIAACYDKLHVEIVDQTVHFYRKSRRTLKNLENSKLADTLFKPTHNGQKDNLNAF